MQKSELMVVKMPDILPTEWALGPRSGNKGMHGA